MQQSRSIGIENFEKEILLEAESSEEMFTKECEMVELGPHSYNIKEGGYGGFDHLNDGSLEHRKRCANGAKKRNNSDSNPFIGKKIGKNFSLITKEDHLKISELSKLPESLEKRKRTMHERNHSQGEKNSQFGTMWVTNGIENRKIRKEDIIPDGCRKGRVLPLHHTTNQPQRAEEGK